MPKKDFIHQECYQEHYRECYQQLSFADFIRHYQTSKPKARLFELSLSWLEATSKFMLESSDSLIVHCLFNEKQALIIAWPLVYEQKNSRIKSLSSFYSAIAEPIYFIQKNNKDNEQNLMRLLVFIEQSFIESKISWQSMQLGSFEQDSMITAAIAGHFPAHKVFAQTGNIYQASLNDFEQYYQQRPSQLRNTIKRRSKKLAKEHQYEISIITNLADFTIAFSDYKKIYQQSWKGEEYSFAFIEDVCLAALNENKLRLGLLYINGEAAAAQIWFVQDCLSVTGKLEKNVSIFKLAYNPQYQKYSVGSILSMALSEHVIKNDQATSIEFGMGSEPYKSDWLANKRKRVSYQVFNQRCFYGKLSTIRHILLPNLLDKITSRFIR